MNVRGVLVVARLYPALQLSHDWVLYRDKIPSVSMKCCNLYYGFQRRIREVQTQTMSTSPAVMRQRASVACSECRRRRTRVNVHFYQTYKRLAHIIYTSVQKGRRIALVFNAKCMAIFAIPTCKTTENGRNASQKHLSGY